MLIGQGEIDRYYDGHVPADLWRAINRKQPVGLFDFVEEPYTLSNTSQTLKNRWEYEEHLVHLTQFFEEVEEEYKRHEAEIGFPLENFR